MVKKKIKVIFGEYGVIILFIGIAIGLMISLGVTSYVINDLSKQEVNSFTPNSIPNSQEEILNNCKNLDLKQTSICFRDNIKTFYNYSNDEIEYRSINGKYYIINEFNKNESSYQETNIKLIDYLKENGGECEQWSLLYLELCEKIGFKCNEVTNGGVLNIIDGHKYMIMSNSTNYCKLDLLKVSCGENKK